MCHAGGREVVVMGYWKVGDVVVHKRDGVCRIKEIKSMNLTGDGERSYYILVPVYDDGTKIYVPADQETGTLRKPLSVEEINAMIDEIPEHRSAWIENEKLRTREYGQILDRGSMENVLGVVSALIKKKNERTRAGRKFHSSDERILDDGCRMLHGEFAYMLNISPDDVPAYIEKKLAALG